ncbi:MAG: IS3 family transposase [Butyricicoccus sp.]
MNLSEKRPARYGKRFYSRPELVQMIHDHIYYYNTQRVQRNLGVVTPMKKSQMAFAA